MGTLVRRGAATFVAGIVGAAIVWSSAAQAQSEPPGRVGRLAFTDGTVSFQTVVFDAALDLSWADPSRWYVYSYRGHRWMF